jgi:hypothetical protein
MKKVILASISILALGLSFQSCKKHDMPEPETKYQTIEIVLDENKAYQYNFGTPASELTITKQSSAFLISQLDEASETVLFNYMPQTNFVGTDEVQITLGDEKNEHHEHGNHPPKPHLFGHKKHTCDKHEEGKTVYIFKFTINKVEATETTSQVVVNEKL